MNKLIIKLEFMLHETHRVFDMDYPNPTDEEIALHEAYCEGLKDAIRAIKNEQANQ